MAGPTPDPIDLDAALRGQSPALAAKDAVYRLARAASPEAAGRLEALVREGQTLPIRQRAALGLSLASDARAALLPLLAVDEPRVLAAVLLSLARVGVADDLPAMRAAASRLAEPDAAQARFAELLIAHRLGLGLDVVRPVPTPAAAKPQGRTQAISTGAAQERTTAVARVVLNASLGFEPDMARAEPVQCGRRRLLIMPATGMTGGAIRTFLAARAVIGATAAYEREPGAWYHDLLDPFHAGRGRRRASSVDAGRTRRLRRHRTDRERRLHLRTERDG